MKNYIMLDYDVKIELTQEQVEQLKLYYEVDDDKNLFASGEYHLVLK